MLDFLQPFTHIDLCGVQEAHKDWFTAALAGRGHAGGGGGGGGRAALRYAKVARDGICQPREWLLLTTGAFQSRAKPPRFSFWEECSASVGESLHREKHGDCAMNVTSRERWETGSGEELTSPGCRQDGSRRSFRLMWDDETAADRPYVVFKIYICVICVLFGQTTVGAEKIWKTNQLTGSLLIFRSEWQFKALSQMLLL